MGEAEQLRDKAAHARRLAEYIADKHARAALRAFADELESKATELEHLAP